MLPTYPGLHPDLNLSGYPNLLIRAVHRFAQLFYVTRTFSPVEIGNSSYRAILVRPISEFSNYIHADRELLILFAHYETFEIRTLDAYDEFYAQLEYKRADTSLRFLVSCDHNIESIIRHYLDQHPEYPVIIPLTFQQVLSSAGNPALEAVRRNYLIRDLFAYQNPLREETFFFGRQDIVNQVLDMAKSGQNSSLFGLRKSGKTSTIYAIARKAKAFSCNSTVIDCQNPAVHARKFGDLLAYIVSRSMRAIGREKKIKTLGNSPVEVSESFSDYMNAILGQSKGHMLIIFDEIENITPGTAASSHWNSDNDALYLWQTLRSFTQSEGRGRLSICLVGTSPLLLELPKLQDVANPMYLFAPRTFIPNLSFEDTQEMVKTLGYFMGLEFAPELVSNLYSEYGGHPFFIRQVCSKVHGLSSVNRPVEVSETTLRQAQKEFGGQLEVYLGEIFGHLESVYSDEFELLRAVVGGKTDEISEFGREAPELIDHLMGYGIIAKRGDDYDVRFRAIRASLEKVLSTDTMEERWAEISERRNRLEREIRQTLYQWARNISSEEWRRVLEENLTKKRYSELAVFEPNSLFSTKSSPLYLSDLVRLLKDQRVLPFLRERRRAVVEDLAIVNKFRIDAHAKEMGDYEMDGIRSAFDMLETEFLQP